MIEISQAVQLAHDVDHLAARLSDAERDRILKAALLLGEVRALTLDRDYWVRAMRVLGDLAPTLANELVHLIDTVEEIHQRIPSYRPRNGTPT